MTLHYLGEEYELFKGVILFPSPERDSLWVEIRWLRTDGKQFTFTIEQFPGKSEADILGLHKFECANDCDPEWDRQYVIGTYDGVHANLYNGRIEISRSQQGIRINVVGVIFDSMGDAEDQDGCPLVFEETISETT